MEYRVEELAAAAGIRVDTLRFYQARGLLPAPRRDGRVAVYGESHLERLRRIRSLQRQGFTLAQIKRVASDTGGERPGPARSSLLSALVEESAGERTLRYAELAAESGVPEVLIRAAVAAGLMQPGEVDGEPCFGEADLEMARAALAILDAGFPLQDLLGLALSHHRQTAEVCERAIDLFDDHIRKREDGDSEQQIAEVFRRLLPEVTRLVARHFQQTLVKRALGRLAQSEEREALRAAIEATRSAGLEVVWKDA